VSDEKIQALREPGSGVPDGLLSAMELAVLRFTDLLTTYPGNVRQSDLDDLGDHLDPDQVFDLVLAAATAAWTARMNDGLQTPVPD
jgi:alkylhydroperoxidase family enzyme